jgi:CheY-like chemotaxis protein
MLSGRPALIVEEEFLIALDIQRMLEAIGVGQTLFARNAAEAHHLQAQWSELSVAILELRLSDPRNRALADELAALGIPVVIITGDRGHKIDAPLVSKPVSEEALASAIQQALAARV